MKGLAHLYVFKTVVDCSGLSAASRQLGVPKSTLARRVSALERMLGASLFHRGTRGFVLTNFGQECYAQCARVVHEADKVFELADRMKESPVGSLHVICPPLLGITIIETLAAEFTMAAPQLRFHLEETTSVFDPRDVLADLVIVPVFDHIPDLDVVVKNISPIPYLLVSAPRVLCGHPAITTPDDLENFERIGFGSRTSRMTWTLCRDGETRVLRFTPRFSSTLLSAVREAALRGLGIAALPLTLCQEHLGTGRLVHVLEGWNLPSATLVAVFPSSRALTTAARGFLDLMVARLPEIVAGSRPITRKISERGASTGRSTRSKR